MSALVAINDGHLYVHENDIWLLFDSFLNTGEVFQGFLAVPGSRHLETEFANGFRSNLLVDRTWTGQLDSVFRSHLDTYLSSTTKTWILALSDAGSSWSGLDVDDMPKRVRRDPALLACIPSKGGGVPTIW